MMHRQDADLGWKFDHSYTRLDACFYTRIAPTPVANPRLVIVNQALANKLGLALETLSGDAMAQLFSGNHLPQGAEPIAQAYAGHQFGHFAMLGDGRAHLIGEHITPQGTRVDIQLKGSGKTPYGRRGDGRAALGPMLREYLISEAMFALGIPTTRSLAVVSTGEPVLREAPLTGAVLTRVASSHLRVGTFAYASTLNDHARLQQLADYAIHRHFPEIAVSDQPYLNLLARVMDTQITLVTEWLRVGFIHGVMNTDNMAISGETIDYGPCAFMDAYDPQTVFSSIDQLGRYAFMNQPPIAGWNLARLAEALLPLLHTDQKKAIALAEALLNNFHTKFQQEWLAMMRRKLGLLTEDPEDAQLIGDLLQWMQRTGADYTNSFRDLSYNRLSESDCYQEEHFQRWHARWQQRLLKHATPQEDAFACMQRTNPAVIPRNHRVEAALKLAQEAGDDSEYRALLDVLAEPYRYHRQYHAYSTPPAPSERVYQTFCGT